MDSRQLPQRKVEQLKQRLTQQLDFLNRLCMRMESLKFPLNDPLFVSANRARESMQTMLTEAETILQPRWRKSIGK
jgi:hypothetical protein